MQTTPGTSLSSEATPEHDTAPRRSRFSVWVAVASMVYALDQVTKWWAERSLAGGPPREVLGDLVQLRLTYNPGAAFSVGTGYTIVLTVIALVVIGVCLTLASRLGSTSWAVALGLLLGGALGNVTDRILRAPAPFRGHVVDFIELPSWPVFNIADSAISVAAVVFVVLSLRGVHLDGTRDERRQSAGSPDDSATSDPARADDDGRP
ncbi:MAG: signal peptidase II [Actinomycetota bacterium]|nr:signal peptidase II [Actinomycetota bacterium]